MLKFTPREIQKQEFRKVIRGYDPVEVDTFLEMVSDEFELMLRVKKDLEERVIKYETELKNYRQVEGTLQETLIEAKRTSTKSLESSKKEAEMIRRDAELKAKEITEEAHRELHRLHEELNMMKKQRDSMLRRLKEWIKVLELDEAEFTGSGEIERRRRSGVPPDRAEDRAGQQTELGETVPDRNQQDENQQTFEPVDEETNAQEEQTQQQTGEHNTEQSSDSQIQNGSNLINKIIDGEEQDISGKPDEE